MTLKHNILTGLLSFSAMLLAILGHSAIAGTAPFA